MKVSEIRQQIKTAADQVRENGPEWIQNILVESSQPTVKVPRTPVNNQATTSEKQETCK